MMTYSVSKSLSTSTPSVLLGRSLTWPNEASTVYPLPRYFEISLTLPGDSTMTKPFANGSSMVGVGFEASTKGQLLATSWENRLSALGARLQEKQPNNHIWIFCQLESEPDLPNLSLQIRHMQGPDGFPEA